MWAAAMVLTVLIFDIILWAPFCEDAYITLRYARNFADGYGFGIWNIGEPPVEGFTSILWMLLMAGLKWLGINMVDGAKVIGVLSHASIIASIIYIPTHSTADRSVVRFFKKIKYPVSIIVALYVPVAWYSSYGLETILFSLLVTVLVYICYLCNNIYLEGAVILVALLCRPEALFVSLSLYIFSALYYRGQDSSRYYTKLYIIGFIILAYTSLLVFRYAYFGSIVPNTYYAKVSGALVFHIWHGVKYLGRWATESIVFFALIVTTITISLKDIYNKGYHIVTKPEISLVVIFCVYCAYIIRVGGDTAPFPMGRHMVHQLPFLAIIVTIPIIKLSRWCNLNAAALSIVVIFLVNGQVLLDDSVRNHIFTGMSNMPHMKNYHPAHGTRKDVFIKWLDTVAIKNSTIAIASAGKTSFELREVKIIDVLGLNTKEVAREGTYDKDGPIDSKTNMDWVLSQRPDVLVLPVDAVGLIEGEKLQRILWKSRDDMIKTAISSNVFCREYVLVLNAPYDSYNRPAFMHKEYVDKAPTVIRSRSLYDTVLCHRK